jgi:hypothetical protein
MYTSSLEIFMQEREIREGKSLHDRSRDYDLPALEARSCLSEIGSLGLEEGKVLSREAFGKLLICPVNRLPAIRHSPW